MTKEELSKNKHIHKIYIGGDGILHCEKYPVVYVNKYYVYLKEYNSVHLKEVDVTRVYDTIDDYLIHSPRYTIYPSMHFCLGYVWYMDDYSSEYMASVLEKLKDARNRTMRDNLTNKIAVYKKRYEDALAELEALDKEED
jgi:hypothetical protein